MFPFKKTLFICLMFYCSLTFSQENKIQLKYSAKNDTLSLISNQVKLKTILGLLSLKSGIQTAIHPDANKKITITINDRPILKAISNLCLNFNCITHFDRDPESNENIITRLEVLPKGQYETILLNDVVPFPNEINIHARKHQASKHERIQKRLELRINQLPLAIRSSLSEEYAYQIKRYQKKQNKQNKRQAEKERFKSERDMQRQAREERLKKRDPKRFTLSEQRRDTPRP